MEFIMNKKQQELKAALQNTINKMAGTGSKYANHNKSTDEVIDMGIASNVKTVCKGICDRYYNAVNELDVSNQRVARFSKILNDGGTLNHSELSNFDWELNKAEGLPIYLNEEQWKMETALEVYKDFGVTYFKPKAYAPTETKGKEINQDALLSRVNNLK